MRLTTLATLVIGFLGALVALYVKGSRIETGITLIAGLVLVHLFVRAYRREVRREQEEEQAKMVLVKVYPEPAPCRKHNIIQRVAQVIWRKKH
jgi:positive regulator of sigma E activity